jgi:hypothetical protein
LAPEKRQNKAARLCAGLGRKNRVRLAYGIRDFYAVFGGPKGVSGASSTELSNPPSYCGSEGRGFKSPRSPQFPNDLAAATDVPVAWLVHDATRAVSVRCGVAAVRISRRGELQAPCVSRENVAPARECRVRQRRQSHALQCLLHKGIARLEEFAPACAVFDCGSHD